VSHLLTPLIGEQFLLTLRCQVSGFPYFGHYNFYLYHDEIIPVSILSIIYLSILSLMPLEPEGALLAYANPFCPEALPV
jgi:hypothetical protein